MRQRADRCGKSVYRRIFTGSEISAFERAKGVKHEVSPHRLDQRPAESLVP